MILLGDLDRILLFSKKNETGRNAMNEPVYGDPTLTRAKARRRDVSDTERVSAGKESSAVMSRFVVLSRPFTRTITPADTFQCDGREWAVEGVKQLAQGRNRFLEISAVSVDET